MFDAMSDRMPAINLVSLESGNGGGRALLVNRMSSEVCAVKAVDAREEARRCPLYS